jgi:hypothetical protein
MLLLPSRCNFCRRERVPPLHDTELLDHSRLQEHRDGISTYQIDRLAPTYNVSQDRYSQTILSPIRSLEYDLISYIRTYRLAHDFPRFLSAARALRIASFQVSLLFADAHRAAFASTADALGSPFAL